MTKTKTGTIYLFPTPISDDTPIQEVLPFENIELLKRITYFVVENTRTARRFISKCKIGIDIDSLTFIELNEHTDKTEIMHMLKPILMGKDAILMSEAGVPAVADPGSDLVSLAHSHNVNIIPLVGPSSIIMSLMSSGMNGQSFVFNGYLPIKDAEKSKKINSMIKDVLSKNQTQIFIETPYRNIKLFESLKTILPPNVKLCVASNISSKNQFIKTLDISEWKKYKEDLPINKVPTIFLIGQS